MSNVYVLATEQSTGGSGSEVKLLFQGQGPYQGLQDTLTFYRTINDSEDEFRHRLVRYLSAGLMPYLARTSRFEHVVISFDQEASSEETNSFSNTNQADDPWNFWVFRAGISGYLSGDNIYQSRSFEGNFRGSRITEDWKHQIAMSAEYSNDIFEFEDDEGALLRYENPNHYLNFEGYSVKSLSDHWSAGADFETFRSTFRNYAYSLQLKSAVEYNVFPYKQSNQRMLTFQYFIGSRYNEYLETTIYEKDREWLFEQELNANLTLVQKWGNYTLRCPGKITCTTSNTTDWKALSAPMCAYLRASPLMWAPGLPSFTTNSTSRKETSPKAMYSSAAVNWRPLSIIGPILASTTPLGRYIITW
ncbi:MAG: hypothetical protein IPJ40_12830 [Saprospirales bacterium]|nr:hypothetical protein [Saprospirales bacterium]